MNRFRRNYLLQLVILLLFAGLVSCGGGGGGIDPQPNTGGFTLNVWDDTYFNGASPASFKVSTTAQANQTMVEVSVSKAKALKAAYYSLVFDPAKYNPVNVYSLDALGSPSEVLEVSNTAERGRVYHGQVLINPDSKAGLNGNASIARVVFENAAQESPASTVSSSIPGKIPLSWDSGSNTLHWKYNNKGDYNQDGTVSMTDLTPLAVNYGESAGSEDSLAYILDGDTDGQVGSGDAQAITDNWGKDIKGGYNVYASPDCKAYPVYDTAPSVLTPLATVPLTAAIGDAANTRLAFQHQVTDPVSGVLYWIRPINKDGTEGISSDLLLGDPAAPGLWVVNPPAISPVAPHVVENSDTYTLMIEDPEDGDVTTDPGTTITIDPAEAATVNGNILTVSAGYEGWFEVFATYNGKEVLPGERSASGNGNGHGCGFFIPRPDSIFALPSSNFIHAGQAVTITVYAYRTAHPFYHLEGARIVCSESTTYLDDSFNLGWPGNDKYHSDGVWSAVNATDYLELPDNFIDGMQMPGWMTYNFNITPLDGSAISNATGALFNFQIVATGKTHISVVKEDLIKATYYSDDTNPSSNVDQFWSHYNVPLVSNVWTYGDVPEMSIYLVDPPSEGDGTRSNPYRIDPNESYSLGVLSDLYGDVTTAPGTNYLVIPDIAGSVSTEDGTITFSDVYSGTIQIRASYGGISTTEDDSLYLFRPGDVRDDYISEYYIGDNTFVGGGSADGFSFEFANYTGTNLDGYQEDFVKIDIIAENAQHLKGLDIEMKLNGDLITFSHTLDESIMNGGLNIGFGLLKMPDQYYRQSTVRKFSDDPNYWFRFAQVLYNPDQVNGFTGTAVIASLLFHKAPMPVTGNIIPPAPTGEDNRAITSFDASSGTFRWYHYNVGDFNQDMFVDQRDIFPLAIHYGEAVPADGNSIQAVIDANQDGRVGLSDIGAIVNFADTMFLRSWVYRGSVSDYPDNGTLVQWFDNFDLRQGDPELERLYYDITIDSPQEGECFWIISGIPPNFGIPSNYATY